jgi:hypothetical protein
MRKPQQAGQAAEIPAAAGAKRGLQVLRRAVARHDVRVGMFFPASGTVQVADQPGHVLAALADLPDHRSPIRRREKRPEKSGAGTSPPPGRRDAIPAFPRHGERHRSHSGRSGPRGEATRNAIRAGTGVPSDHPGTAERSADRGPRGPGLRMARRNLFRRSSPAASSRAARRSLS